MRNRTDTKRGFTLLETIIAIAVLMVGTLGPMMLAQNNLKAARVASDRLIGSFLAQEGIEAVRSKVANDSVDSLNWLAGLAQNGSDPCAPSNQNCIVDVTTLVLTKCVPSGGGPTGCAALAPLYTDASGFYRQPNPGGAWTRSRFNRVINIVEAEPGKRIVASTTVWWPGGNVSLQEDIYNWFFPLN